MSVMKSTHQDGWPACEQGGPDAIHVPKDHRQAHPWSERLGSRISQCQSGHLKYADTREVIQEGKLQIAESAISNGN